MYFLVWNVFLKFHYTLSETIIDQLFLQTGHTTDSSEATLKTKSKTIFLTPHCMNIITAAM